MITVQSEPKISVGLMTAAQSARISFSGRFTLPGGEAIPEGDYTAIVADGAVRLEGLQSFQSSALAVAPDDFDSCRFTIHDITIGIEFHWERKEAQSFQGALRLRAARQGLTVINELPLESYLVSVISSEMSATCPAELLRAHAIVSRSWLLAQLANGAKQESQSDSIEQAHSREELIRWYDRENHSDFDVCADDHCQRYQGISKAFSQSAFEAIRDTRGRALVWGDEICDARYSKSCGGMTELYRAAWQDKDVAYLPAIYDGAGKLSGYDLPLTMEANAEAWITSSPPAYCNNNDAALLARILPGFDQETSDFYRWEVSYSQDELRGILAARLGMDFGRIRALEPVERGWSGRLVKLRIRGENKTLVIGKELEIRRALSRSHLYSSALVVRAYRREGDDFPERFHLIGAGWGHGVGLCQIGAAVMAERGKRHEDILSHYFRGAELRQLY